MSRWRYLVRRLLWATSLVVVVSSAALLLTLIVPGGFLPDDPFTSGAPTSAEVRRSLALDRPVLTLYGEWLARAARLDFGQSLLYSRPVADLVRERALNTGVLAVAALVGATLVGIPLGIYTGTRRRGLGVRAARIASLVLLSMPPLLASLSLVLLAARTGWLPVGGMMSPEASRLAWAPWLADVAAHVPLPALALGLPLAAALERLQSQAIGRAIREPFVAAARARGLSLDAAQVRHAWRTSLGAVLGLYGVMVGTLFSGSFIVEVVTAWPGLGRLMFDALRARDIYLVVGCAATGATFLAIGTVISDLLLLGADPRAQAGSRT